MKKVNTLCNSSNLNKLYLNENNSSKYIKNIQLTLREKLTSQDDHRNKINCMMAQIRKEIVVLIYQEIAHFYEKKTEPRNKKHQLA